VLGLVVVLMGVVESEVSRLWVLLRFSLQEQWELDPWLY
jgi:hypothetical protein